MRKLPSVLLASFCLGILTAQAQVTTTLTLTGSNPLTTTTTLFGAAGTPQAAGANVTQWTGTITVRLNNAFNPTTLTLLSANLVAMNSGSYAPGLNGATTTVALANYGFSSSPVGLTGATSAVRGAAGGLSSTALTLNPSGGGYVYSTTGVSFTTTGDVDFRTTGIGGVLAQSGRGAINSGAIADTSGSSGTVAFSGNTLSLQLPLNVTFASTAASSTFTLNGTLNAVGAIPEPSTTSALIAGGMGLLAVTAYRRQHTKNLALN